MKMSQFLSSLMDLENRHMLLDYVHFALDFDQY